MGLSVAVAVGDYLEVGSYKALFQMRDLLGDLLGDYSKIRPY